MAEKFFEEVKTPSNDPLLTRVQDVRETLQEVLMVAMETGRKKFVELLLDQDYGGDLDFKKLLTVQRLYRLHLTNVRHKT